MLRRILVAIDFSEASDVAMREAAAMSGPGRVLGAVYALPRLVHESLFFPIRDEALERQAKDVLGRATVALRDRVAQIVSRPVDRFVDEGIDYAAIIRRAEIWKADLIVVGSHGHHGLARLLGGVASKVASHAPCDVLVARAHDPGPVIAATDFSSPSLPAVSVAAAEARRRGAPLHVVHAVNFLEAEALYLGAAASPSASPKPDLAVLGGRLREACANLGVDTQCEVLDGRAATAIVRYAESQGAALVVMGARGSTELDRRGFGSVARKVMRASACSVLVVRKSDV